MAQKNLIVTNDWIRKRLKDYTPDKAISEYIENSIDAQAKNIDINYVFDDTWYISKFEIIDDWGGFSEKDLSTTFDVFLFSKKNRSLNKSDVFGKDWVWRLTFFCFSSSATWESRQEGWYIKLKVSSRDLSKYDILDKNSKKSKYTGTKVSFEDVGVSKFFMETDLEKYLIARFSWILLLKGITIRINKKELEYKKYISMEKLSSLIIDKIKFDIKFIKWEDKLIEEESKNYFINSADKEILKEWTSLNRQSDDFHHSVFIQSSFFDKQILNDGWDNLLFEGQNSQNNRETFKDFMVQLNKQLNEFRRPFIESLAETYVNTNIEDITNEEDSIVWEMKTGIIKETIKKIYLVEPKIFTKLWDDQRKIFIRLISAILEEGNSHKLFDIIDNVLALSDMEKERFGTLLKDIKLSNIIRTIDIINERLNVIKFLEQYVFDEELKADEVHNLQKLVESHYRLFWDEYFLIWAAEPDFEQNLRKFLFVLYGIDEKVYIENEHKNKELDIFMCRQDRRWWNVKNIVIELKHPKISLWRKEVDQVKNYLNVITKEPRFNWSNYDWKFFLVWDKFDTSGEINQLIESHQNWGEKDRWLIHKVPTNNVSVYCRKWSDIIEENRTRLEYLRQQLETTYESICKHSKIENKTQWDKKISKSLASLKK